MGWTCSPKPANVKAELRSNYEWDNEFGKRVVLADALVNMGEYYAAVEHTFPDGRVEVWAGIALVKYYPNDYYSMCVKELDETCGPYVYNCPEKIFDLLTDTDHETASRWRQGCRETIEAKKRVKALKVGDTIVLHTPIVFTNGERVSTLRVHERVKRGRKSKIYRTERHTFVKLPLHKYTWEVQQ
jgi:hypothetical protein